MRRSSSPGLSHIVAIVFVTAGCCIGVDAIAARLVVPHRTLRLNSQDKHLKWDDMKHKHLGFKGHFVKVRNRLLERIHDVLDEKTIKRPSKRFHHYLTMTRDFYPSRRSYVKPTKSGELEDTSFVPILNHFTGVKAWSVPYDNVDTIIPTTESAEELQKEGGRNLFYVNTTPNPIPNPKVDEKAIKEKLKDTLFENEYTSKSDIDNLNPLLDLLEGVQEKPFDISNKPFSGSTLSDFFKSRPIEGHDGTVIPETMAQDFTKLDEFNDISPSEYHTADRAMPPFSGVPSFSRYFKLESPTIPPEDTSVLNEDAKEDIFEQEYAASRDIGQLGPIIDLTKLSTRIGNKPPSWTAYPQSISNDGSFKTGNIHNIKSTSDFIANANAGNKDGPNSGRRDFSDFGTFKAFSDGDANAGDLFSLSNSQSSFGKFVPDNSQFNSPFNGFSSGEARWGTAKNRDLMMSIESGNATDRPTDSFRRITGAFKSDKSDCLNIETKSCNTDADCSCYGLFKCSEAVCKSRPSLITTSPNPDSSRDEQPDVYWHDRPYTNEELGIKPIKTT